MTPRAQQIAIAEACGWKWNPANPPTDARPYYTHPTMRAEYNLPDYLNDLNAMHEAELVLRPEGTYGEWPLWDKYVKILGEQHTGCDDVAHATARQKAVAFLKTVGKWEGYG